MVHADAVVVQVLRRYAAACGLSESYASRVLSGSGTTLARLARGGSLTARRAATIIQTASNLWPSGAAWPDDIPRPAPSDAPAAVARRRHGREIARGRALSGKPPEAA